MPFSWIRVPNHESERVRNEIGEEYSRQQFVDCVTAIITNEGGRDPQVYYELNGRWTRILFYWEDFEVKKSVVLALAGEDTVDLLKVKEDDELES